MKKTSSSRLPGVVAEQKNHTKIWIILQACFSKFVFVNDPILYFFRKMEGLDFNSINFGKQKSKPSFTIFNFLRLVAA